MSQSDADRLTTSNGASAEPQAVKGGDEGELVFGKILNDGSDGEPIEVERPVPMKTKISAQEKQKRAMSLKLAGASYAQIAENLGYADASGAHKAVAKGMNNSLQETSSELRKIHYGRLEHMLMLLWPDVNKQDHGAMHTSLQIMDRMERLYGLNAAEKIDVSSGPRETVIVADGDKEAYIQALREAIENDAKPIIDAEVIEDNDNGNIKTSGLSD
jgi:hypothetical protein